VNQDTLDAVKAIREEHYKKYQKFLFDAKEYEYKLRKAEAKLGEGPVYYPHVKRMYDSAKAKVEEVQPLPQDLHPSLLPQYERDRERRLKPLKLELMRWENELRILEVKHNIVDGNYEAAIEGYRAELAAEIGMERPSAPEEKIDYKIIGEYNGEYNFSP
jgi:hypothetical protein